ncbi:hypothetical protein N431DRAFT_528575 [Stipitochalara longipes BDJ]|nr:hypothetical protein N431DRAFT_528575 [Stipitochalara longipes BDJ]
MREHSFSITAMPDSNAINNDAAWLNRGSQFVRFTSEPIYLGKMSTPEPMQITKKETVDQGAPQPERSLREKGIDIMISWGLSPHGAVYAWEFLINVQFYAFIGISFAVLSYFFFDGTYLGMFGLYLIYHHEVLGYILSELIFLLPSEVPFFEAFLHMDVSVPYFHVAGFYILAAVVLELSGVLVRQIYLLPMRIMAIFQCLVAAYWYIITTEAVFMYKIGLESWPWYLQWLFGIWFTAQVLLFCTRAFLSIVRLALVMAFRTVRGVIKCLPRIWEALLNWLLWWLGGMKELLLKIHGFLISPISFRRHKHLLYSYTPLHTGDEISLLLLRGSFWGLEIHAKLIHANIHKLPPYECISHRWENSTKTKTIVLNGRNLKVSPNVYNILRIRRPAFSSRLIWIDSVCINQEDSKEKSCQVRMMQTIYAKATRVTQNEWITSPEWLALRKLFRHTWFERCWIIQEVVLASNVYVLYGGTYIDWNVLLGLISAFIQEQGGPIRRLIAGETSQQMVSTPASLLHGPILEGYRRTYRERLPLEFHALLRSSLTFRATDPRDKMFALQGISEAANSLAIDYDLDVEQVLLNTARYLLKTPECIEVLQHAGIGWTEEPDHSKRPSWVVDWSRTRPIESGSLSCFRFGDWYLYRAAIERKPEIRELDNNRIELKGLHLDHVKIRGNVLPIPPEHRLQDDKEENDKYMLWLRKAESIARTLPSQYHHTGQSRSEAFWRTCIGDRNAFTRPADPDYGAKFLDFREATIRKYALDHMSCIPGPTPLSENENLLQEEGEFLEARFQARNPFMEHFQNSFLYSNALGSCSSGRCFAISENGYMIIAPPGTQEGDMVCLIIGAQVPFLLRPVSISKGESLEAKQCYALVGECYVHGLMDGEGLKHEFDEQNFLIC